MPEAYRDWGVELFDWQSQCSSTCSRPAAAATSPAAAAADPQQQSQQHASAPSGRRLYQICKRLMPTVGCEADAVAFIEEVEDVWRGISDGCARSALLRQRTGTAPHWQPRVLPGTHHKGLCCCMRDWRRLRAPSSVQE